MAELQHSTQHFPSKNSFQFSWIKQKFNSVCGIYSKRWGKMANGKCRFSTPKHVIGTGWCRMTQHKIKYCAIIHRWYSKIHRISYFNAGINLWYSWLFSVVPASQLKSALRDIPHIIFLVLRLRNIFIYVNREKKHQEFIHVEYMRLNNKYQRTHHQRAHKNSRKRKSSRCWLNSSYRFCPRQRSSSDIRARESEKEIKAIQSDLHSVSILSQTFMWPQ